MKVYVVSPGESTEFPIDISNNEKHAKLSAALVRLCMKDGDEASKILSEKLTSINSQLLELKSKIPQDTNASELDVHIDTALSDLTLALMQLQFFDRVSQRLDHASQSAERVIDPVEALEKPIQDQFTMEDERILYDALEDGFDILTAVESATVKLDDTLDKSDGDDIELF